MLLSTTVLAAEDEMLFKEPAVIELLVTYQDGETSHTLSLLPLEDDQPQIAMQAGNALRFQVRFDNLERLDRVYITSTKSDDVKYLEAVYDQSAGAYIADGYFDPDDTDYVPGTIGVTYTKKVVAVTEDNAIDSDIELGAVKTQLENQGISLREVQADGDGTVTAQVVFGEMLGGAADVYVDAAISTLIADSNIDEDELEQWLDVYGKLEDLAFYQLNGADGKAYTMYLDYGDADTYLMIIRDVTGNKYTKMLINKAAESLSLGDISDSLSHVNTVSKMLLDYSAISKEVDELREDVAASPMMTAAQRQEANAKIDALENDKKLFMMGTTILPMFVGATVITGGAAMAAAPALLFSALLSGITATSNYFWEHRIGMIQGCEPIAEVFSGSTAHAGWIPLTEAYFAEKGSYIGESGNYYLAEDVSNINIEISGKVSSPINVTICLHGHNVGHIRNRGNCTLYIRDCKYAERPNGTVVGGTILQGISNSSSGTLHISGGTAARLVSDETAPVFVNDGTATVDGGLLIGGIHNGGELTIKSGIVRGAGANEGVSNYGTLNLVGGTVTDGEGSRPCILNSGKFTMRGGTVEAIGDLNGRVIVAIDNDNRGEMTLSGGTVYALNSSNSIGSIGLSNKGTVIITGGTVMADYTGISNRGQLTIKKGIVKANMFGIYNGKETTISGGTVAADVSCIDNSGQLTISGGVIESTGNDSYSVLLNKGELTMSGGILQGTPWSLDNRGKATITDAATVTNGINNTKAGQLIISNGITEGQIWNEGNVTVSGGTVTEGINNIGQLTVNGGIVESTGMCGICSFPDTNTTVNGGIVESISNMGQLTVNGGVIKSTDESGIFNASGANTTVNGGTIESIYNMGQLTVNGGLIESSRWGIFNQDGGKLTISGGTVNAKYGIGSFYGSDGYTGEIKLLITKTSKIEINSQEQAFDTPPILEAATGYDGGVTYYSAANAEGVWKTIQDASELCSTAPHMSYFRLEADGASAASAPPKVWIVGGALRPDGTSEAGIVLQGRGTVCSGQLSLHYDPEMTVEIEESSGCTVLENTNGRLVISLNADTSFDGETVLLTLTCSNATESALTLSDVQLCGSNGSVIPETDIRSGGISAGGILTAVVNEARIERTDFGQTVTVAVDLTDLGYYSEPLKEAVSVLALYENRQLKGTGIQPTTAFNSGISEVTLSANASGTVTEYRVFLLDNMQSLSPLYMALTSGLHVLS